MLFTTVVFTLLFLPIAWAGFFALGRRSPPAAAAWLFLASLVFYSFWLPEATLLLVASIAFNFFCGGRIAHARQAVGRRWLIVAVCANLAVLAYFKYANFFVANLSHLLGTQWHLGKVLLPIGISFYSFTQIAFLVDTYRGKVNEFNPIHYGLFVTYFPHLVAGPVLHHAQMMPQFAESTTYRINGANVAAGLFIFALGLVKKVVLADGISPYADAVFHAADAGVMPQGREAWLGALAYTLQLYFDFSGYSDMAIGLSLMFNIRLPANFNSPYRATNISEFWRRWHISLSTFLRDYLYIALGGNRRGPVRRYVNLVATMVLGGLWHGAGWSFILWGLLHGLYLMTNHAFRALVGPELHARLSAFASWRLASWLLTMLAVVAAWVFFRAETLHGALRVLQAMSLAGSDPAGPAPLIWNAGLDLWRGALWCVALGMMATTLPNSGAIGQWVLGRLQGQWWLRWYLGAFSMLCVALLVLINTMRDSVSAFIYFNF
ncbi:MAG: MBOAT family O-acyltransferase [Rhizobacter sp.]